MNITWNHPCGLKQPACKAWLCWTPFFAGLLVSLSTGAHSPGTFARYAPSWRTANTAEKTFCCQALCNQADKAKGAGCRGSRSHEFSGEPEERNGCDIFDQAHCFQKRPVVCCLETSRVYPKDCLFALNLAFKPQWLARSPSSSQPLSLARPSVCRRIDNAVHTRENVLARQ